MPGRLDLEYDLSVMQAFSRDIAVVGGGGRVGLPLALLMADSGLSTAIFDVDRARVAEIRAGRMPFQEEGGQELLTRTLAAGRLDATDQPDVLAQCRYVILVVGTPVDEHLNPSYTAIHRALDGCRDHLRDGQTLILRSTVFPGITQHIAEYLAAQGLNLSVAFCPERVAQGHSIREFRELPQILGSSDPAVLADLRTLFGRFTSEFIEMEPMEAEIAKLMTNSWRYIQFAIVNQFQMIASERGLDFDRILHACRHKYPRMAGAPGPGFAAGPCLLKDTLQLVSFSRNTFVLGNAAVTVNEGLPFHLIQLAKREGSLKTRTVGILGMAFKANSDDRRDSLSYKLKKLLMLEARTVLCSDPYVTDPALVPLERVLAEADVLFVGSPHDIYRGIKIPETTRVVDIWNHLGR